MSDNLIWAEINAIRKLAKKRKPESPLVAYAGIHVDDHTNAQSIPTGATYTKITEWDENGLSANCTPDQANDKITFTKIGIYQVTGSFNFYSGTANVTFRGAAFLNAVEQHQVHWMGKVGNANDVASCSFVGFIDVTTANWDLDFRLRHDNGGNVDFYLEYGSLNVLYFGPT